MYNPSYDFKLLDMPNISPLQAQEFGILPTLRPSDPTGYVDFSLGQLGALYNPNNANPYPQLQFPADMSVIPSPSFFQSPSNEIQQAQADVDAKKAAYEKAVQDAIKTGGISTGSTPRKCDSSDGFWNRILGRCCTGDVINGKCTLVSDGNTGGTGVLSQALGANFSGIPQGAGIFLIAIVIIILLLLIARR